jgi:hypothetical protein
MLSDQQLLCHRLHRMQYLGVFLLAGKHVNLIHPLRLDPEHVVDPSVGPRSGCGELPQAWSTCTGLTVFAYT